VIQSYYNKRIVGCPGGEGGTVLLMLEYPKRLPILVLTCILARLKIFIFLEKYLETSMNPLLI